MSDTSEESERSERPVDKEDSLCRDYVRGICDRKFCKYKHEYEPRMLNFCHDYQNNICPRNNCKFIHCTPEDEIEYKRTGIMSNHILAEATRKNQLPGTPPICNQFRKGLCRRSYCKYRHLTKEEEDAEIFELIQNNIKKNGFPFNNNNNNNNNSCYTDQLLTTNQNLIRRNNGIDDDFDDCGISKAKRRFILSQDNRKSRPIFKGYFAGNPPSAMISRADARTIMLEEENNLLHKEIAQLKRQVSDLTATNEFLLDQNANLRVSKKININENMPPAVTITNTTNQQQVIGTVASVATVPVSLATVSTCNPVSVSIAGCPTVSMASPAQLLAPSHHQQILVTTTNPQNHQLAAIANNSQAQLALAQQNFGNNLAAAAQQTSTQQQIQQLASLAANQQQHNQSQQLHIQSNQQQQLTSSQPQQLTITNMPQQLAIAAAAANTNQQLLANNQQIEIHKINSSQAIAMSNATQPMVSYSIMTQQHALSH